MPWSRKFKPPFETNKGVRLNTLADLRTYILKLSPGKQSQQEWIRTTELALAAVDDPKVMEPLRRQVGLAFLLNGDVERDG